VGEETYIGALKASLRTFRTAASMFGRLDREIEEAWDSGNVEWALSLEKLAVEYKEHRRRIAWSLYLATVRLQQAGAKIPNPRWKPPPWLLLEWEAMVDSAQPGVSPNDELGE